MSATKLLAITMVAALLLTGVTAVSALPTDGGPDLPEEANESADEAADQANKSANAADGPPSVGPPDGLPEPVPDFVSDLHATIESFLSGATENLGEALRSIVPGGNGA
ncbi:MAG: hypothetical protein ACOC0X_00075 [Halobacteriota archaeon]